MMRVQQSRLEFCEHKEDTVTDDLITTLADNKHMFREKAMKEEVLEKMAQECLLCITLPLVALVILKWLSFPFVKVLPHKGCSRW